MVKKRFPQAGGVGVSRNLGEEKEKVTRDQGLKNRIERVGERVDIWASCLRLLLLSAREGK